MIQESLLSHVLTDDSKSLNLWSYEVAREALIDYLLASLSSFSTLQQFPQELQVSDRSDETTGHKMSQYSHQQPMNSEAKRQFLCDYYRINLPTFDLIEYHISCYWPLSQEYSRAENFLMIQSLLQLDSALIQDAGQKEQIRAAILEYQKETSTSVFAKLFVNEFYDARVSDLSKISYGLLCAIYGRWGGDFSDLSIIFPVATYAADAQLSHIRTQLLQNSDQNPLTDQISHEARSLIDYINVKGTPEPKPLIELLLNMIIYPAQYTEIISYIALVRSIQNQQSFSEREMFQQLNRLMETHFDCCIKQDPQLSLKFYQLLEKVLTQQDVFKKLCQHITSFHDLPSSEIKQKIIELVNCDELQHIQCINTVQDWRESKQYGLSLPKQAEFLFRIVNQFSWDTMESLKDTVRDHDVLCFLKNPLVFSEIAKNQYREILFEAVYESLGVSQEDRELFYLCWKSLYWIYWEEDETPCQTYDRGYRKFIDQYSQSPETVHNFFAEYHQVHFEFDMSQSRCWICSAGKLNTSAIFGMISDVPFDDIDAVFEYFYQALKKNNPKELKDFYSLWACVALKKDQEYLFNGWLTETLCLGELLWMHGFCSWFNLYQAEEDRKVLYLVASTIIKTNVQFYQMKNQYLQQKVIEILNRIPIASNPVTNLELRLYPIIQDLRDWAMLIKNGWMLREYGWMLFHPMFMQWIEALMQTSFSELKRDSLKIKEILMIFNDHEITEYLSVFRFDWIKLLNQIVIIRDSNEIRLLFQQILGILYPQFNEAQKKFCSWCFVSTQCVREIVTARLYHEYEFLSPTEAIDIYDVMGPDFPFIAKILTIIFQEKDEKLYFERNRLRAWTQHALEKYQEIDCRYFKTHLVRIDDETSFEYPPRYESLIARLTQAQDPAISIDVMILAKEIVRHVADVQNAQLSRRENTSDFLCVQSLFNLFTKTQDASLAVMDNPLIADVLRKIFGTQTAECIRQIKTHVFDQRQDLKDIFLNELLSEFSRIRHIQKNHRDSPRCEKTDKRVIAQIDRLLVSFFDQMVQFVGDSQYLHDLYSDPLVRQCCHQLLQRRSSMLHHRLLPQNILFSRFMINRRGNFFHHSPSSLYHRCLTWIQEVSNDLKYSAALNCKEARLLLFSAQSALHSAHEDQSQTPHPS